MCEAVAVNALEWLTESIKDELNCVRYTGKPKTVRDHRPPEMLQGAKMVRALAAMRLRQSWREGKSKRRWSNT